MSKKSKIFYYAILATNVLMFILDLLPLPTKFEFFRTSFGVTLILIGIMLAIRAFSLKIDSSLFFGVVLFCCGVLNIVIYFAKLPTSQMWPYYFFAVSIGSIITAIYFKDKLQIKIFFLTLGFGLITLLFVQHLIKLWLMIVLVVVWFVLYFVVNTLLYKRRHNGQKRNWVSK